MPFISTAHHTLHYITKGEPINPPILMLHGFLGSHKDFEPLLGALSYHFYCIVLDLPGHGQTQANLNSYTFSKTAESLLTLLNHFGIQQTHLLGYSMGGRLALYLACNFPDRFTRIVLESASPGLKTAEEREKRIERDDAIAHRIETTPLSAFLTQWYQNPLFGSLQNYPQAYAAMIQRRMDNSPTELAKALRGFSTGRQSSLWEKLPSVKVPLLLIVGSRDPKFIAINREMHSVSVKTAVSNIELEIVALCGHNAHLELPSQYLESVVLFLS